MSLPSSFGSQVSAIMDMLAKAAVTEITKLVEEGGVVLRLEMCRRDSEIQELKANGAKEGVRITILRFTHLIASVITLYFSVIL